MNACLNWFSRLTWIGLAANLAVVALGFFAPDVLEALLGPGSTEFAVLWVPYAAFLLLAASLFSIPAARDPIGLHVYAWIAVIGRGLGTAYWLWTDGRFELPGLIQTIWIVDAVFFVGLFLCLQLGLPTEFRVSPANFGRALAGVGKGLMAIFQPEDGTSNGALKTFGILTLITVATCLWFAIPALFNPASAQKLYGGVSAKWSYLWLGQCGMLLVILSLYLLPAGAYPARYKTFAWAAPGLWTASSLLWLVLTQIWSPPAPLSIFWILDGLLAAALFVCLQRGLPEGSRFDPAAWVATLSGFFSAAFRSLLKPVNLVLAILLVALGAHAIHSVQSHLLDIQPDKIFDDPAEQFKYGAIGLAVEARVPLYLWEVLPELCGDKLPDPELGMASLGLIYEEGKSLPIGFAERHQGYPAVEPNCSLCHTGNYRTEAGGAQQVSLGGSAGSLDLQAFQWFLYDCAARPNFTAEAAAAIKKKHNLSAAKAFLYRWVIVPTAKTGLDTQREAYSWQKSRPTQGRGRTDTFNPTKITVFNLPDDGTIGTVDLPAIWNQKAREGLWLHWDGNNNSIYERNYAAAMAVGATPHSVLPSHFKVVTDYVLSLPPTPFPFPVDEDKAARGWEVFKAQCADCHAFGGPKIGTVTDLAEIGTDSHRLHSFTEQLVDNFHTVHEGRFQFDAYRKTQGYANVPIDGIWQRAPYLHNGSVPTLWHLLQAPAERPTSFFRGYEVYDPVQMGYVHDGPEAEKAGWKQDASEAGNGNGGHVYGTELSDDEKWDLIEYLKTL